MRQKTDLLQFKDSQHDEAHTPDLSVVRVPQHWLNTQCDLLLGQISGVVHSGMSISSLYRSRKLQTQLLYSRQTTKNTVTQRSHQLDSIQICIRDQMMLVFFYTIPFICICRTDILLVLLVFATFCLHITTIFFFTFSLHQQQQYNIYCLMFPNGKHDKGSLSTLHKCNYSF